jgi:hypothetical protein
MKQYQQVLNRVMREMLEEHQRREERGGANDVEPQLYERDEREGGARPKSSVGAFAARRNTLKLELDIPRPPRSLEFDIPPRPRSGAFHVPEGRKERVGEQLREINERWGFPEVKKE